MLPGGHFGDLGLKGLEGTGEERCDLISGVRLGEEVGELIKMGA